MSILKCSFIYVPKEFSKDRHIDEDKD